MQTVIIDTVIFKRSGAFVLPSGRKKISAFRSFVVDILTSQYLITCRTTFFAFRLTGYSFPPSTRKKTSELRGFVVDMLTSQYLISCRTTFLHSCSKDIFFLLVLVEILLVCFVEL